MGSTAMVSALALLVGLALLGGIAYSLIGPRGGGMEVPTEPPSVVITIVGGEIGTTFAFGIEGTGLSSPGPEIRVKQGEVVRITFRNIGEIPHSFKIVEEERFDAPALFGASIGDFARPLNPGQEGSTVFKADRPGTFIYICSVPGHLERGMLGKLIVEPAS